MPRRRPASAAPSATLLSLPAPSAFLASRHLLPGVHSPPDGEGRPSDCSRQRSLRLAGLAVLAVALSVALVVPPVSSALVPGRAPAPLAISVPTAWRGSAGEAPTPLAGGGTLDYLATEGIEIRHARMMDLGAGLGMLSEEAAFRGATPVAIEPGSGFRHITLERIQRGGRGVVIAAMGEHLPFRDSSFDVVISLQLLEHVEHPAAVVREVYRILKPGGWLYLTCANYLSFHEGHYDIALLPLLLKRLGALYLRLRGRPTEFLKTSITYTTLPGVRRTLRACGFLSMRERHIAALCRAPAAMNTPWKRGMVLAARRWVSADVLARALACLEQTAHVCTPNFSELVQKPPAQHD
jgi:SAM-dependent methyltransferase